MNFWLHCFPGIANVVVKFCYHTISFACSVNKTSVFSKRWCRYQHEVWSLVVKYTQIHTFRSKLIMKLGVDLTNGLTNWLLWKKLQNTGVKKKIPCFRWKQYSFHWKKPRYIAFNQSEPRNLSTGPSTEETVHRVLLCNRVERSMVLNSCHNRYLLIMKISDTIPS